ncbi:acyloxyacyl hydrolase [Aureitalea sp. L0-47]|uniref:acyloxyacyl hydrolase n=1 Tax=Aureitalea sp. L0-47 TaxID=2816962 RepID=UPI0022375F29|nr:acyloxyacyl hydrolase [Aureitalea sp. L0-47]MCW5520326.1 acyloxyacyl hydrolase [Aureitalea sp. L0-47]
MNKFSFLIVFLATFGLQAQKDSTFVDSRPTVLGISFDYAALLKHTDFLRELDDSYPVAIRLDWSKHLITKKSWDFCNCFPRVGVSVAYWNWDSPDVLGSGFSALGYLEPYMRTHKRTNFFFRAGLGGVYLTDPYDEVSNPLNLSYSTRLAYFLLVGAGVNYRITDKLNLRLAAKYNHISNGGKQTPNKGLNFPSLSVGLNTSLTPISFPEVRKNGKREPPEQRKRITLTHFSGWSNANVGDKDKFYVFGLAANYSRWIGGRSALTIGTEWIADYSRREKIKLAGTDDSFHQGAVLAGHEFWLGRVTFSQQFGLYYYRDFRDTDDVYQRYGLTYEFVKNIFVGMNLKAHGHVADFFDFRLGYRF